MQALSKYKKGINYLLFATDLFTKYAWVVPFKYKRGISIVNIFQKIISKERKPNKIWVDQDGDCYNKFFKRFFKINSIEMYSTYNEENYIVAEIFIRLLENKIFKHMTVVSKNVYFYVLDDVLINAITQFTQALK